MGYSNLFLEYPIYNVLMYYRIIPKNILLYAFSVS